MMLLFGYVTVTFVAGVSAIYVLSLVRAEIAAARATAH